LVTKELALLLLPPKGEDLSEKTLGKFYCQKIILNLTGQYLGEAKKFPLIKGVPASGRRGLCLFN
jgi:hypothetical protein